MATSTPLSYAEDPTLFLYTSLTAGSSHIITATSRLETILKANKIAFRAIDTATDEKARMIWGRRSRGRRLPGLVKYAQVVGDLEQIEEWNEYGELKEQIEDTPVDEPVSMRPAAPAAPAQLSAPASRDSSQGRHISIAEPPKSADRNSEATLDQSESPMAIAMRRAGAEAAAKAGQKKTLKLMPAAPEPTEKDTTAPVVEAKIASPMADPSADPGMTQAKIPAQLAAEGATRTSVDKIAETEAAPDASGTASGGSETPISKEQRVADLMRASSITKAPSKLSESQTQMQVAEEAAEVKRKPKFEERPTTHRGSSLSQVSAEEIRDMERRNSIEEVLDEDAEDAVEKAPVVKDIAAKDEAEKPVNDIGATDQGEKAVKDIETTDNGEAPATEEPVMENSDPKDAESTGVSVGD